MSMTVFFTRRSQTYCRPCRDRFGDCSSSRCTDIATNIIRCRQGDGGVHVGVLADVLVFGAFGTTSGQPREAVWESLLAKKNNRRNDSAGYRGLTMGGSNIAASSEENSDSETVKLHIQ